MQCVLTKVFVHLRMCFVLLIPLPGDLTTMLSTSRAFGARVGFVSQTPAIGGSLPRLPLLLAETLNPSTHFILCLMMAASMNT